METLPNVSGEMAFFMGDLVVALLTTGAAVHACTYSGTAYALAVAWFMCQHLNEFALLLLEPGTCYIPINHSLDHSLKGHLMEVIYTLLIMYS